MIRISLPRLVLIAIAFGSFIFIFTTQGLNREFNGITLVKAISGSVIVYIILSFVNLVEFDSNHLKFLKGPKEYLQKGLIALEGIEKITWRDSQQITLDVSENGRLNQYNILGDKSKIEILIGFIKGKNRNVILNEENKLKFISLVLPKPVRKLLIICIIIFIVGMIFVAKQRAWLR